MGKQNGLQKEMARVEEYMPKVRDRHGTDIATYLGFNTPVSSQIKFSDNVTINGWPGSKYIGEWCAQTDKPNGRGIAIFGNGEIWIGYYKDGDVAAGNYIFIYSNGWFNLGEYYFDANGRLKDRFTCYYADGTSRKYSF